MEFNVIMQYILSLMPAFTAIIGMIVCISVGINKIRKSSAEAEKAVKEIKNENFILRLNVQEYDSELQALRNELLEMKDYIRRMSARMDHVHIVDIENKGE